MTFVPETATELIVLVTELTTTKKADLAGTILARIWSYVRIRTEGVASSTEELTYTGLTGLTLLVTNR
jgi:hypothetical protein